MPEDNEPEKVWDEYDWERFLQQQDRKTEQYLELLEKYIDDPDRDQIIAREMGWSHCFASEDDEEEEASPGEEWATSSFEIGEESEEDEDAGEVESFEFHPLYQASFALTVWIDQLFEELGEVQNHPAAVRLATNCAVASAKLAAALSDDEVDEIAMTIAYLKRALKAMTLAIDAGAQFARPARLTTSQRRQLRRRLFRVRDGIIELMGRYRGEWRRRYNR